MGLSMILIMLFHQMWVTNDPISIWIHHLGYIGVEVFLVISGFGIAHSLSKNSLSIYFRNRIVRILPACVIWGSIKLLVSQLPNTPECETNILLELLSISSWYIYACLVLYALAPLLFKVNSRYGWLTLVAISVLTFGIACIWHYNADAPYLMEKGRWVFKRIPVFVMGMLIAQRPLNLNIYVTITLGFMALICNVLMIHYNIVLTATGKPENMLEELVYNSPLRVDQPDGGRYLLDMLSVLFIIPFFSGFSVLLDKIKMTPVLTFFGIYSLEIYLCHQYIFNVFLENFSFNPIIELTVSVCVSLFVAIIIHYLANNIQMKLKN